MVKIPVVIVVYNPCVCDFISKLHLFTQFHHIYIIDNSEYINEYLKQLQFENFVTYVPLQDNKGVAYGNNMGIKLALRDGYSWVATFDQDSIPPENYVKRISDIILKSNIKEIGLIGIVYDEKSKKNKLNTDSIKQVQECISSGSCISGYAFTEVGGQKEEYFIDCVDFEFCWNLRRNGFKILQVQDLLMSHKLGEKFMEKKILGKHLLYLTNHIPIRKYYYVRNSLYLFKEYRGVFRRDVLQKMKTLVKTIIKSVFWEKNKIVSIQYIIKGYQDYKKGIYGRYKPKQ